MPRTFSNRRFFFRVVLAAWCAVSVSYAGERISSDIRVTTKDQLSAKEKRSLFQAAVRILKDVHHAFPERTSTSRRVLRVLEAGFGRNFLQEVAPRF